MYKRTLSWILVTVMTLSSMFVYPALASDTPVLAEGLTPVSFDKPATYHLTGTPTNLITGKFDSNATPDLVALPTSSTGLTLLLGNTNGTLSSPVYVTTSKNPVMASSGNFNSDTVADLAVATDNGVEIFLGTGAGTFVKHAEYTEPLEPSAVLVDDFNRDGRADFVVTTATSDKVTMFLGKGDGTFSSAGESLIGQVPGKILAADFNSDGKLDLATVVVMSAGSNSITILWGDGNGLFSSRTNIDSTGDTASSYISDIAISDINGDGNPDILLAHSNLSNTSIADGTGLVTVLYGNGFGGFKAPLNVFSGGDPSAILVADFNGDKKPDIAISNFYKKNVTIITSDGNGKFAQTQTFDVGAGPIELIAVDFDGDGDTDLATLNSSGISVLLNSYVNNYGNIKFELPELAITEGTSNYIKVIRTGDLVGPISVSYSTKSSTAVSGTNFVPYSGTLSWADGDSSAKTIAYATVDDDVYSGYLTYSYVLSNGIELPVKITDNDAPPTPQSLRATAGDGRVTLVWNNVKDAAYKVYYSTTPTGFSETSSMIIEDSNQVTVTGLTNGTMYYFAVKAAHGTQSSAVSAAVSSRPTGKGSVYTGDVIIEKNEGGNTYILQIDGSTVGGTSSATITKSMVEKLLDAQYKNRKNRKNQKDSLEIVIDTSKTATRLIVTMPHEILTLISDKTNASFGISSSLYSITFDHRAIDSILMRRSGGDVVIDTDTAAGNGKLYDININVNGKSIENLGKGKAKIEFPYTLGAREKKNSIVLYYVKDNGKLKSFRGGYNKKTGMVEFKTSTIRDYLISSNYVTFKDVKHDKWYKDAIDFISARGIASGFGDNNFGPERLLTRGQFIVMLMNAYNIEPENANNYRGKSHFKDIGNTFYTDYLIVAKGMGLVNGVGDNKFAPERTITRQEMIVMLYNTLALLEELPETTVSQSGNYLDANMIAPWAQESMATFLALGIISGNNNRINPRAVTTRAEMAQILYNLLSY